MAIINDLLIFITTDFMVNYPYGKHFPNTKAYGEVKPQIFYEACKKKASDLFPHLLTISKKNTLIL